MHFFVKMYLFSVQQHNVFFVFIVLNFIKMVVIMFVYFYITLCKRNKWLNAFTIETDGFKAQI